jgi:hypothetical protein
MHENKLYIGARLVGIVRKLQVASFAATPRIPWLHGCRTDAGLKATLDLD